MFFDTPRRTFAAVVGMACVASLFLPSVARAQAVTVTLAQKNGAFQLMRSGKPYFVKGAGGSASLPDLKAAGANSLRTWGADNIGPILDAAQKQNMTVLVGIWFGHREHGFSYLNEKQVAEQYERAKQTVTKYKNHPAVLAWAMGNEMENGADGGDAVWKAVEAAAKAAKQIDPGHPVMTVVAEIGGDKVKKISALCPDVDIIGINSYGGATSLPARYKAAGGVKPYVLTEFGPPGTWESGKKSWGATPELTSTEKGRIYGRVYQAAVKNQPLCLGSYAFTWGNKQEATATWFGMLLPNGEKLAAVDAMTEAWTGTPPKNLCPVMSDLSLAGEDQVEPNATVHANLKASDPENAKINVRWLLQRDDVPKPSGGDTEPIPPTFPEAVKKGDLTGADVQMPKFPGAYRLFAYLDDGSNAAAVGNIPLFVKEGAAKTADATPAPTSGDAKPDALRKPALPYVLYAEPGKRDDTYAASGWMGNTASIQMNEGSTVKPHTGGTCLKVDYKAAGEWAGVVWQSPAGDWGDKPGGLNLTGAKKLTFWARGESGNEEVTFQFGLLGKDKKYGDSASGKKDKARLTTEWREYSIDLSGLDLSRIKTGFGWVVAGQGKPVTFYLDDIRYE